MVQLELCKAKEVSSANSKPDQSKVFDSATQLVPRLLIGSGVRNSPSTVLSTCLAHLRHFADHAASAYVISVRSDRCSYGKSTHAHSLNGACRYANETVHDRGNTSLTLCSLSRSFES